MKAYKVDVCKASLHCVAIIIIFQLFIICKHIRLVETQHYRIGAVLQSFILICGRRFGDQKIS